MIRVKPGTAFPLPNVERCAGSKGSLIDKRRSGEFIAETKGFDTASSTLVVAACEKFVISARSASP